MVCSPRKYLTQKETEELNNRTWNITTDDSDVSEASDDDSVANKNYDPNLQEETSSEDHHPIRPEKGRLMPGKVTIPQENSADRNEAPLQPSSPGPGPSWFFSENVLKK